ncbi:DUF1345 domain-containing protein [Pedobacter gandavensis]|uniref:DUF1345 domain-containing protein n=1 Tax=Pedobacter gandavensis TaxID=2679963 RepID=UPI00292ED378|nr:DUF1345 domain-containing protein [Pedobacter gandavensis]
MVGRLRKIANYINQVDAHHKLYTSIGVAVLFFVATTGKFKDPIHYMLAWLAYVMSTLILAWITILSSHPADVKNEAHAQDSSRTVIFFFVIAVAFASLLAVLLLLENASSQTEKEFSGTALIPLACVAGSWWLLHTVFTLRYAHLYYCDLDHHKGGKNIKPEGLIFPDEEEPDYMDFTYFSFVIGMTFQVSDVQITSRKIRRLAWMHGILAFAFNTFIVALTINIIAGLTQK